MRIFLRERQALVTWLIAGGFGIMVAYFIGIIRYHSVGVAVGQHSYGWSRIGFGANGELATLGLIGIAYMAIRLITTVMGVRGTYR